MVAADGRMRPDAQHGFAAAGARNDAAVERVEFGTAHGPGPIGDLRGPGFGLIANPQRILPITDQCP
ncbi:hypothetical protein MPUL_30840 [Mycolicibacterium pulveris]|uniref:Uncharacterized protein n=1 Tax=Mycolicibacterium pulveris TaxID=36813 RepID=A0A7I7UP26_MYCPV|nr:hypothetical protein MPUL_30840 [Mycolicibacterium pulveris]